MNLVSTPAVSGSSRDSSARVILCRGKARPLWFGHPWVYANAVERLEGEAAAGDVVSLVDHDGRFIGRGIFNPRSQIPVRLLTRKDEAIDATFFATRLREAQALRTRLNLPSADTTAYRLVNSEGDGLPGLVVDVFGDAAVVQITTLGLALRRDAIFDAVQACVTPRTVYEVAAGSYAEVEGLVAHSRAIWSLAWRTACVLKPNRSRVRRQACSSTSGRAVFVSGSFPARARDCVCSTATPTRADLGCRRPAQERAK
jgi:hypothetical protein